MSAMDLRQEFLSLLDDFTTTLIEAPDVDARGDVHHMFMERNLEVARIGFCAYEQMALLTKENHNKSYAFKDLPADERKRYRSVKHKIDLLSSLYGPKTEA